MQKKNSRKLTRRAKGGKLFGKGRFGLVVGDPAIPCKDKEIDTTNQTVSKILFNKDDIKNEFDSIDEFKRIYGKDFGPYMLFPTEMCDIKEDILTQEPFNKPTYWNKTDSNTIKVNPETVSLTIVKDNIRKDIDLKNTSMIIYPKAADAFQYFNEIKELNDFNNALSKFVNIAEGIKLLQESYYMHGDIKLANILYHEGEFKLGDLVTVMPIHQTRFSDLRMWVNNIEYYYPPSLAYLSKIYINPACNNFIEYMNKKMNKKSLTEDESKLYDDINNHIPKPKLNNTYKIDTIGEYIELYEKISNITVQMPESKTITLNCDDELFGIKDDIYYSNISKSPRHKTETLIMNQRKYDRHTDLCEYYKPKLDKYYETKEDTHIVNLYYDLIYRIDIYQFGLCLIHCINIAITNNIITNKGLYNPLFAIIEECCRQNESRAIFNYAFINKYNNAMKIIQEAAKETEVNVAPTNPTTNNATITKGPITNPTANATTNATTTKGPITKGPITKGPITNATTTKGPITKGPTNPTATNPTAAKAAPTKKTTYNATAYNGKNGKNPMQQ